MAARRLAFGAGGGCQREGRRVHVELRVQFQQALVNATQFFRSKIAVVHGTAHVAFGGQCQRADGVQQITVRQVGPVQVGRCLCGKEETPQRR